MSQDQAYPENTVYKLHGGKAHPLKVATGCLLFYVLSHTSPLSFLSESEKPERIFALRPDLSKNGAFNLQSYLAWLNFSHILRD